MRGPRDRVVPPLTRAGFQVVSPDRLPSTLFAQAPLQPAAGPVPAHDAGRDGGAGLGRLRRGAGDRRRLRRPSQLRGGADRPAAGGPRAAGGDHRPARLALGRGVRRAGPPAPDVRGHRREHGLDGEPLHQRPAHPQRRRLFARRHGGPAPRPLGDRLRPALPGGVPGRAAGDRRHRGQPAADRPLRLLVREGAALDPAGRQGRPAGVRQRRAAGGGDRPAPGRGGAGRRAGRRPGDRVRPPARTAAGGVRARSTPARSTRPGPLPRRVDPYAAEPAGSPVQGRGAGAGAP